MQQQAFRLSMLSLILYNNDGKAFVVHLERSEDVWKHHG